MKLFKSKNIHFVGIGGAGMIGIARVLLQKGYKISGSDISDSMSLRSLGRMELKFIGHSKENILGADLLVMSSAIDKNNPEIIKANKESITISKSRNVRQYHDWV